MIADVMEWHYKWSTKDMTALVHSQGAHYVDEDVAWGMEMAMSDIS